MYIGDETGWLIEEWDRKRNELHGLWWTTAFTGDIYGGWVKDSTMALRFARECDAQAYIDEMGWTEAKPTEHRWCALCNG